MLSLAGVSALGPSSPPGIAEGARSDLVTKEERVLRLLLAVALAGAVLVPLAAIDAAHASAETKPREGKSTAAPKTRSTKALHGAEKTASSSTRTGKKPQTGTKAQDDTVTPNRGTIDAIGVVSRGQVIDVHATALRSGQLCALQIFYEDKPAKIIRDVTPDTKKRCTFTATVPDRPGVVGVAKVKLILTSATSGKPSGEAKQTFNVT